MTAFSRADTSVLSRWWWTVDHWILGAVAALMCFGAVLILAASPPVADRIGLDPFYFARRQLTLMPAAAAIVVWVSLLSPRRIRGLATAVFVVSLAALVATLVVGEEIKGARRWITLAGFSLQPSEFIKPSFAVVAGWLLAHRRLSDGMPLSLGATLLFALIVTLLALQPDLGMAVMVAAVWGAQVFLAGLPLAWVGVLAALGCSASVTAYLVFPHVASRIDRFLDPASGDSYQVSTSLEAFMTGGLVGQGPGEGTVKHALPDAHSDFIFAVAGEELGLLVCLILVGLFAFIVLRGFTRLLQENDLFVFLAATGLLVQFGLQALINMGSSLSLLPTKGMTLPFISYGGSSLLALALAMGMVLALTRRRCGVGSAR